MLLDLDNMYSNKNRFSILYEEAEKNDLDILGFSSIFSTLNITNNKFIYRYFSSPILYQPNISSIMSEVVGKNVKQKAVLYGFLCPKLNFLSQLL